jgi:hypothetical protein
VGEAMRKSYRPNEADISLPDYGFFLRASGDWT